MDERDCMFKLNPEVTKLMQRKEETEVKKIKIKKDQK
jgi:hypothetical protein